MARWTALILLLAAAAPAQTVKLRVGNSTRELGLEQYVAGVLAGESSVFQSREALKAMAVAARTYAVRLRGRHKSEGYDFCATTHCQHVDFDAVTSRLVDVVGETAGELLWFQGKPAFACYTRDCGGRTEDAGSVWPDLAAPYLKSHEDPYCAGAAWQWSADPIKVIEALRRAGLRAPARLNQIAIVERTGSRRARTLSLDSVRIDASAFRFAVGRELGWNLVRSDAYEVHGLAFNGRGSGHGVGLCQLGADRMGRPYRDILAFYYPGTSVGLTATGLSWTRLGGEGISLMTTRPNEDRVVLEVAERMAGSSPLPRVQGIEIRIYPDLDTFRNATGEPGWVAARTDGRRIQMQPASVLRSRGVLESTIRHELLHVTIEAQAVQGLPAWFREGLAGYLEHPIRTGAPTRPSDADLRQRVDPEKARRAYRDATRAVTSLVERQGEGVVLGWLRTGLPPIVR
jgi:stage II sporulation protein D